MILIVDDDRAFRALMATVCARAGYSCVEAGTAEEALSAARTERPDVVLLDVCLRASSGFALCRDLRERFGEQLPIIFLSGVRIEQSDRIAGLLLGGDDYLEKPVDQEELLARMRRALARATPAARANGTSLAAAAGLTGRESEILALLASGHGTAAIANELVISPKTVATHVQRILAKLDVHSRSEAVAFAYREGLVDDVSAHLLTPSSP
jgi:DNA-binding NarL/FixJ family response regulator